MQLAVVLFGRFLTIETGRAPVDDKAPVDAPVEHRLGFAYLEEGEATNVRGSVTYTGNLEPWGADADDDE